MGAQATGHLNCLDESWRSWCQLPEPLTRRTVFVESVAHGSLEGTRVEALLRWLGPAWTELRSLLNDLNGVLVLGSAARPR
jgi:hypothetical protein